MRAKLLMVLGIATVAGSGCAVVSVAGAAVSVAATTVSIGASVVGAAVDVTAAGVKAVVGSDEAKCPEGMVCQPAPK